MLNIFFKIFGLAALASALLLVGCSDFDEMKGNRMLSQAQNLMEQGNKLEAETVLAELVAKYPSTQAGGLARKNLAQLKRQRENSERAPFVKILDSYQQVLNGYYSLYAEYPGTLAALDQSGYFFDSAYLEEIIPEGYLVYLLLENDGSSYQLWCVSQQLSRGYKVGPRSRSAEAFDRDEMLREISARFLVSASDRKIVTLQQKR